MEVSRRIRRQAAGLATTGFILALGIAGLVYNAPSLTTTAAHAFVTPAIHARTSSNGLAQIQLGASPPAQHSVASASDAGQELQMQLLLESTN